MKRMAPAFILLAFLCAYPSCAKSADDGGKGTKAAQTGAVPVKWHTFDEGLALAREKGRPVLMDFYALWCGWCRKMDAEVFADPEVSARLAEKYVCIRLHTDTNVAETIRYKNHVVTKQEFMMMLGVEGLPTLVFLDREGNLITKVPGFVSRSVMLPLLAYIEKECYIKKISFTDYVNGTVSCGGAK